MNTPDEIGAKLDELIRELEERAELRCRWGCHALIRDDHGRWCPAYRDDQLEALLDRLDAEASHGEPSSHCDR